tara:strand:+ start:632 stop:835 length:204 start_codon:yes stop_codon:yes gene_type:complete
MTNEWLHIIIANNPDGSTPSHRTLNHSMFNGKIIWCNWLETVVPREIKIKWLTSDWDDPGQVKRVLR